jgi:hypothetical protein
MMVHKHFGLVLLAWTALSGLSFGQAKQPSLGLPQSKIGTTPAQTKAPQSKAAPQQASATQAQMTPMQIANALAQAHQAWAVGMDSPLASISLKEIARNGAVFTYNLYASGMSSNKLYNIVAWPVNQPRAVEVVKGVGLDAVGLAICPGQLGSCGDVTKPNQPTNLSLTIAPGRPLRVGLVAQDESERAFMKSIPMPILGADKNCKLEAITLTMSAAAVLLEGSGFPPNSDIEMQLVNSANPTPTLGKGKVEANGVYSAAIVPLVDGVTNGSMKVSVKSAACNPSLSFEWGVKPAPGAPPAAPPAAAPAK